MDDQDTRIGNLAQGLVIAETKIDHQKEEFDDLKGLVKEIAENVLIMEKNTIDEQSSLKATLKTISILFTIITTVISCVCAIIVID